MQTLAKALVKKWKDLVAAQEPLRSPVSWLSTAIAAVIPPLLGRDLAPQISCARCGARAGSRWKCGLPTEAAAARLRPKSPPSAPRQVASETSRVRGGRGGGRRGFRRGRTRGSCRRARTRPPRRRTTTRARRRWTSTRAPRRRHRRPAPAAPWRKWRSCDRRPAVYWPPLFDFGLGWLAAAYWQLCVWLYVQSRSRRRSRDRSVSWRSKEAKKG